MRAGLSGRVEGHLPHHHLGNRRVHLPLGRIHQLLADLRDFLVILGSPARTWLRFRAGCRTVGRGPLVLQFLELIAQQRELGRRERLGKLQHGCLHALPRPVRLGDPIQPLAAHGHLEARARLPARRIDIAHVRRGLLRVRHLGQRQEQTHHRDHQTAKLVTLLVHVYMISVSRPPISTPAPAAASICRWASASSSWFCSPPPSSI